MRITHTEYHVTIFFAHKTRKIVQSSSHQFTNKIEVSIRDAICDAARMKVKELVNAGRLAKGFGVELTS
jgi:hypothetical protein